MPATSRITLLCQVWSYFLHHHVAKALPASDSAPSPTAVPGIVTATATIDGGKTVAETFTPTNITIAGLTAPLTAATTISTTDSAGRAVAIAVAAGAAIGAGGAFAGWLFEPVPGGPGPPNTPPVEPTPTTDKPAPTSDESTTATEEPTETEVEACPLASQGKPVQLAPVQSQPQWVLDIPAPSVKSFKPECTPTGNQKQLLRGTDPGYLKALVDVFCKTDLSKDQGKTLGQEDLPNDSSWKNSKLDGIKVEFGFKFKNNYPACPKNCAEAYGKAINSCQYNSHVLYGGLSLEQGCGTYDFTIDAEPNTRLDCAPPANPATKYAYRDFAMEAIESFCTAQDGASVGKDNHDIEEVAFTIAYASNCTGSGKYMIGKERCSRYLRETVDNCDTDTTMYKHGGTVTDTDNCGAFTFHPTNFDAFSCYPSNKDQGLIPATGGHVAIAPDMAKDAIDQFCSREGDGQSWTLDPGITVNDGFTGDTCKEPGMASCGYFYTNDGKRVTEAGNLGDVSVRMSVRYIDPQNGLTCPPRQKYDIHGERCKQMMSKVIGTEPKGKCVGSDPNKLDLGSFLESSEKGCVVWNMWAVGTH